MVGGLGDELGLPGSAKRSVVTRLEIPGILQAKGIKVYCYCIGILLMVLRS
jgi:hypothetical protein